MTDMINRQRVILLRHAHSQFQTSFEASGVDPGIIDAPLSELGVEQVRQLAANSASLAIDMTVCSPLTRALETVVGVFKGPPVCPVVIEPLLRERLGDSCDIGRPVSVLSRDYPFFDFSQLPERWWYDGPKDARGIPIEPRERLAERVSEFRSWLAARPEGSILVVGHSEFLTRLSGRQLPNCEPYEWNDPD